MQKLLKPIINSVNQSYIQHLYQRLLWLNEYLRLNSRLKRGLIVVGASDP